MAELVNDYRNLLWAAIFMLIAGSYAFTGLALVYLSRDSGQMMQHVTAVGSEVRDIRDRQTRAITSAEAEHRRLQTEIDRKK